MTSMLPYARHSFHTPSPAPKPYNTGHPGLAELAKHYPVNLNSKVPMSKLYKVKAFFTNLHSNNFTCLFHVSPSTLPLHCQHVATVITATEDASGRARSNGLQQAVAMTILQRQRNRSALLDAQIEYHEAFESKDNRQSFLSNHKE